MANAQEQLVALNTAIAGVESRGHLSATEQQELAKCARRILLLVVDHNWVSTPRQADVRRFLEMAAQKLQRLSHDGSLATKTEHGQ